MAPAPEFAKRHKEIFLPTAIAGGLRTPGTRRLRCRPKAPGGAVALTVALVRPWPGACAARNRRPVLVSITAVYQRVAVDHAALAALPASRIFRNRPHDRWAFFW